MNLDTTIDIDPKKFFKWWGAELAFLLPKRLRQRLRNRHGRVVFTPTNTPGFEVNVLDDDDQLLTKQTLEIDQLERWQMLKQQFQVIGKAEIVLRLSSAQALHKVIYLPVAAQENLQQVVGFELDRYTPFSSDKVYYATVPMGNTEYLQLRVLLIVVPQPILDAQLAALATLGVRPHRVEYAATSVEFPQISNSYNLLPDRFRQQQSTLKQAVHWLAGFALLFLTVAVLVWPVWQESQAVESLKQRIKQLEKQNKVVDAQQSEIDAVHAETQQLIDNKQQAPALLAVLSELSRLLNDDTWLTHFHFSETRLQIQGQSPAASALIGILETSEYFSGVSFVSPLTQDKRTGRERFQISMTVTMPDQIANSQPTTSKDEAETLAPFVEEPILQDADTPNSTEEVPVAE